jgi:hypothetical protein
MTIYSGTASSGYLFFADGTTGNQPYRGWVGYLHPYDALSFATSATSRMLINSAGNVGIGTSSPSLPLHVYNSAAALAYFESTNANGAYTIWRNSGTSFGDVGSALGISGSGSASDFMVASRAGSMILGTSSAERMRITSGGNVGIGTTSPASRLQLGTLSSVSTGTPETISLGGTYSNSAGANIKLKVYDDSAGTVGGMNVSGGQIEVNTWSAGKIAFYRGTTQSAIIDASGNVGIGTTSPAYKLVVQKTATATPAIMIGGGFPGGPRLQVYGLDNNPIAFMGLGTDMGGNAYEHSIYFPTWAGNTSRCTIGDYDGTTYNTRFTVLSSGTSISSGDSRAPIFYDSNNTGYYVDPASTSNLNALNVVSGNTIMRRLTTLDMSGLDSGTWYPVTIPISAAETYRFRIENGLNSNVPSWSTHPAGFSILLDWTTNGSGWGVNVILRNIQKYTQSFASVTICAGVTQMNQSSNEVVYLRGGGIYYFYSDRFVEPTIRTSSYTINGQTVAPTGSIVNDVIGAASGALGVASVISYDLVARSRTDSPIYYDIDNTGFYLDPAGGTSAYLNGDINIPGTIRFRNGGATTTYMTESYGINLYGAGIQPVSVRNCSLTVGVSPSGANYGSGTIYATGDIIAYYSDERLKDIKGKIENPIEKLLSLDGFYYEANDIAVSLGYEKKLEVGLSAQQVERILPEIIKEAPADNNYKTFNYAKLAPLFVEGFKAQQQIIENQQTQIEELKELVNKLINK